MIIGLTGGSGGGKSTVAQRLGGVVITSDAIYHELLSENEELQCELINRFGTFERAELREIVFSNNKEPLKDLESITHKYIVQEIEKRIESLKDEKLVIIDASIVLVKTDLNYICDKVIAVMADKAVRVYRIMKRDGLTQDEAEARIKSQPKDEVYLDKADAVVYNNGDINKVVSKIKELIN